VGCGRRAPKGELVRLHLRDGDVVVGPGPGRGAYLCPRQSCLVKARAGRSIVRSLHARPELPDTLRTAVVAAGRQPPA
jgi:predicted RNA-binding protein YlxR (DUF448 family)